MNKTVEHKEHNYVLHIWHKEQQPDWAVIMLEINSFMGSVYFYPAGKMGGEQYHVVLITDEPLSAEGIAAVVECFKNAPEQWFEKKGGSNG